MAKPRARSAAAARASPAPTSSDPNLPTPTSIPRADLSAAKAAVGSANRSSVGSSSSASATDLPAPAARDVLSIAKEVGKRLAYDDEDDDSALPTAALQPEIIPGGLDDLAPLLELPDPDDASSTSVLSASADSTMTQVAAPAADSATVDAGADAEAPVPLTEMEAVLAELRGARGLTPRSKRLLAALAETASAELDYNPTAAALRMHRAAFWRKVRVGILAATVFSVVAMDFALAVAFFAARRANGRYSHVLTPT